MVDESTLVHNALNQGYINLTFRCDAPYSYSPLKMSKKYDTSQKTVETSISQFEHGTFDRTQLSEGKIQLKNSKVKWSDFSPEDRWSTIF
ncbi:hypothetical protein D1872_287720 [compost metagenome]